MFKKYKLVWTKNNFSFKNNKFYTIPLDYKENFLINNEILLKTYFILIENLCKSLLQFGHFLVLNSDVSHSLKHLAWKICLHLGVMITKSFKINSHKSIVQIASPENFNLLLNSTETIFAFNLLTLAQI